ncbi:MAG TPA: hypothetical protein VGK73_23895 [Polyangiaceae bacterium]
MDQAVRDPSLERRRHRSEDALEALTRLLESARRRSGLEALAVTDSTGLLLAGAGASQLCDELAAWAPVMAHAPANDSVPNCLDAFESRTRLRRLRVDGFEIVVACLGQERGDAPLDAVSAGCQRILGSAPARS